MSKERGFVSPEGGRLGPFGLVLLSGWFAGVEGWGCPVVASRPLLDGGLEIVGRCGLLGLRHGECHLLWVLRQFPLVGVG
jgi:hypothetical protein